MKVIVHVLIVQLDTGDSDDVYHVSVYETETGARAGVKAFADADVHCVANHPDDYHYWKNVFHAKQLPMPQNPTRWTDSHLAAYFAAKDMRWSVHELEVHP